MCFGITRWLECGALCVPFICVLERYDHRVFQYMNWVMTDVSCQQDDWNVPCSDDENYGVHGKVSINFCAISLR